MVHDQGAHQRLVRQIAKGPGTVDSLASSTSTDVTTAAVTPTSSDAVTSSAADSSVAAVATPSTTPSTTSQDQHTTSQAVATVIATTQSSSSSSSSLSSLRSTSSSLSSSSISSSAASFSTEVVTAINAPSNVFSSSSVAAATALTSGSSSGGGGSPGVGTVVGIVAGSLVGLVVLAALIGMLLKRKWGNEDEDYQDNPFGNEKDFTHLPDTSSSDGHLSLRLPPTLTRSGTVASTSSQAYSMHSHSVPPQWDASLAPPMPSFQPGQVVQYPSIHPGRVSPAPSPTMGQFTGGYGMGMPPQQEYYGGQALGYPLNQDILNLERAASTYLTGPQALAPEGRVSRQPSQLSADPPRPEAGPRPLSLVNEEEEKMSEARYSGEVGGVEQRSGTPTNPNVQQSYYDRHQESAVCSDGMGSSDVDLLGHGGGHAQNGLGGNLDNGMGGFLQPGEEGRTRVLTGVEVERDVRAQRTLSVRNVHARDDDVYGGI